ncbi:MAG: 6-phospho-beta-glucosidase [Chloroflexi bacterium]|nr:6-phospho-beta-glucosidase [Chloroflexota bacterium]
MIPIQKITVIGGGSTYTPEFVDGFIQRREQLSVGEIALYDINAERLELVGGLVRRMAAHAGLETTVATYTNRPAAIEGADFIISQIRVGGVDARIRDEKIPLKYNVIGQETTGPGGFMKAMRTIPATLDIARDVERYAPNAWYLNFTNPSGIITEALLTHTPLKVVGLCNNPINAIMAIAEYAGVPDEEVFLDWVGLNHLAWIRRAWVKGRALEIEELVQLASQHGHFPFEPDLIRLLGMLPIGYLAYYYYHDEAVREAQRAGKTRGEVVKEVEGELLKMYADPNLVVKPPELMKRGGAYYSEMAVRLITSLLTDRRDVQIVITRNNGCILDLPASASIEVPCVVGAHGVSPLHVGHLPEIIRPLVQTVKAYEQYAVEAGVSGSRETALKALFTHPLVPSYSVAKAMLTELLEANKEYLPQFFGKKS